MLQQTLPTNTGLVAVLIESCMCSRNAQIACSQNHTYLSDMYHREALNSFMVILIVFINKLYAILIFSFLFSLCVFSFANDL